MKLPLITVVGLIAVAGCGKKHDSAGKTRDTERKNEARSFDARQQSDSSTVEAILSKLNGNDLRTKEEADRLKNGICSLSNPDLLALLEKIGKTRNLSQNRTAFASAIGELAKRDPEGVMSWFPAGEITGDEAGYTAVMGVLAESRPDILKAWLTNDLTKASKGVQASWLDMGLRCLSRHDPASALEFWKTIGPNLLDNHESIAAIFGNYGKMSPSEALAAAEASFKGSDLDYARYEIAAGINDPVVSIEIANEISDPFSRGTIIAGALSELMISDRPAALKKLAELDPKDLQAALQTGAENPDSLVKKLGKSDPDTLVGLLEKIVASSSTADIFKAAVGSLSADNPDKAMALVESMPDGKMKTEMLGSQFRTLALEDPLAALEQAARLGSGDSRHRAYESIGDTVGARGLEETLKLAGSLAPQDKESFLGSALVSIGTRDPKKAAEVLASGDIALAEGKKNDLVELVGSSLGRTDASYATDWLAKLPESQQPHAMRGIATQMARSDILGLSAMLGSLPRNRAWESGVKVLIENIKGADPERAAQWQELLTEASSK